MINFFNSKNNDLMMIRPARIKNVVAGKDDNDVATVRQISDGFVPYTGATSDLNLGSKSLISQSVYGSESASGTLTLFSTSNATKGKIIFGSSAYDESVDRLTIGSTTTQAYALEVIKSAGSFGVVGIRCTNTNSGGFSIISSKGEVSTISLFAVGSAGSVGGAYSNNNMMVACNGSGEFGMSNENATATFGLYVGGYGAAKQQITVQTDGRTNFRNKIYVGNIVTVPTAYLHLLAGTSVANTAPIKLTSGVNLTTPETGAIEYNGTNLFFTRSGTTREGVLTQSAVTTEALVSDTSVTVNIGGTTYKLLARA